MLYEFTWRNNSLVVCVYSTEGNK